MNCSPPSVTAPDAALIEMLRNGNHGSTREVAIPASLAPKHIYSALSNLLYQTDQIESVVSLKLYICQLAQRAF